MVRRHCQRATGTTPPHHRWLHGTRWMGLLKSFLSRFVNAYPFILPPLNTRLYKPASLSAGFMATRQCIQPRPLLKTHNAYMLLEMQCYWACIVHKQGPPGMVSTRRRRHDACIHHMINRCLRAAQIAQCYTKYHQTGLNIADSR